MNTKSKATLEKLRLALRAKNYSSSTVKMYVHYAGLFLADYAQDLYHISQAKAKQHLVTKQYTSVSMQNQYISAVKALYYYVAGVKLQGVEVERPRAEKRLPQVIDSAYLLKSIAAIKNLKHRAIISIAYSVGLRVSEVCNLKIADIDSKRMLITVRQAKGNKDRMVPLSTSILDLLRQYFTAYHPVEYLFNGQHRLQYSPGSCNQIVKKYLGSQYHFHLLRHSSFTAMLESGTDLRIIQKIAGHSSSRTTEIYTHVSSNLLQSVNTPL